MGVIEVKCRCGRLVTLGGDFSQASHDEYALTLNKYGDIVHASASATEALGYTMPELLSLSIDKIATTYTKEAVQSLFARLWAMRGRDQFHFTDPSSLHKRKDGQLLVRHLRWKFVRLPHEDYFFGVYRPLEKAHVAKEFQDLPQASLQVLKVDQQGICHEADDSITALLGYHPSEVIGRSFESFFEKPAELQFKNNIAKRLSSFMHNKYLIRRDGSKLQVDVLISPIPQADGEVKAYGVYWIDRDLQTVRA